MHVEVGLVRIFSYDTVSLFKLQLTACRFNPWAKANLNYSAQALLISAGNAWIILFKVFSQALLFL